MLRQALAKHLPWIFQTDIKPEQRIDKKFGGCLSIIFGLSAVGVIFLGLSSFSRAPFMSVFCLLLGIATWMVLVIPIMRRLKEPSDPAVPASAPDRVQEVGSRDMPYPDLLENETLIDIIGNPKRSLAVTTFRIIECDVAWGSRTEKILQLDEIDSYGTSRVHQPNLRLASIAVLIGGIGWAIYMGNQPKANEATTAWTVVGSIALSAVLYGCYRASVGFTMNIKSKRTEIDQATNANGLPLHQAFLKSVQKAVQDAKVTQ